MGFQNMCQFIFYIYFSGLVKFISIFQIENLQNEKIFIANCQD